MNNPSIVSTIACPDYEKCGGPIRRALELAGLIEDLRGKRVLLKPNMMKGTPPGTPEATHPAFVGALTAILVENGCSVTVGDSSGILGFTKEIFEASGMARAVEEAGGKMINFDAGPFTMIDLGGRFAGTVVPVARALLDADAVLDVPKMKTHTFLGLTLSVKNFMGAFPGAVKPHLHTIAPDRTRFAELVAGIPDALTSAGVNIAGSIVDGVLALGGRGGSVEPAPVWMGCVVAGRDIFHVDRVCARLAGFDPATVPLCNAEQILPSRAGVTSTIEVVGDIIRPFPLVRPGNDLVESTPALTLAYYLARKNLVRPVHDPSRCADCNKCVEVCPVGCIIVKAPRRRLIGATCNGCLACRESCPEGAMTLHANPMLKPFLKKRARGLDMGRIR